MGRIASNDEAVSSVIGAILMVLLVLILAAVLITWAMSFTEHQPGSPIEDDDDPQRTAISGAMAGRAVPGEDTDTGEMTFAPEETAWR